MGFSFRQFAGNANVIKFLRRLLRFIIPLSAIIYLIYFLFNLPADIFLIWKNGLDFNLVTASLLVLLLLLSFANWMLEAMKWKMLSGKLEPVSLAKAFTGVLYGTTLGMVTPKRSGEFLGRTMILMPSNRIQGMIINLAGSFLQLSVTVFLGLASMIVVFQISSLNGDLLSVTSLVIAFVAAVAGFFVFLALISFSGSQSLAGKVYRQVGSPGWMRRLGVFRQIHGHEMVLLALWSLTRYLVFIAQFYLLLRVFNVPVNVATAFLLLAITYLFLSPIPVSAVAEAGVRGSVVLLVYEMFFAADLTLASGMEISLVAAMLAMWLVNLALPATTGAVLGVSGLVAENKKVV